MLADNLIDSDKPPEGELDRPAVEPDHTQDDLIYEVDPVPGLKDINSLGRLFLFFFNPFFKLLHHFFPCNLSLLHLEPQILIRHVILSWDVLEGLWQRGFYVELDGALLLIYHHSNRCGKLFHGSVDCLGNLH